MNTKNINLYNIIILIFIISGIAIRTALFIHNPSLFRDEAKLALNLIEIPNYLGFFEPLKLLQVAPPMFMILAKFIYNFADISTITPYQSDLLLRVVPFIAGILTIPTFGYLLWKIFKNRFITAIGLGAISLCPLLITFSVNFKQYSLEALISILILIITLHINVKEDSFIKNAIKFSLLGITPFFSMTSLYILPFVCVYLLIGAVKEKCVKNFLIGASFTIIMLLVYYLVFLKGIIVAHYSDMIDFWDKKIKFKNYNFLVYALSVIIFAKNIRKIFLFGGPILLTLALVLLQEYPCKDRLFVFVIPFVIIIYLFPLSLLIKEKYQQNKIFLSGIFVMCIISIFAFIRPIDEYRYRHEYGREILEVLAHNYNKNSTVIFGKSINTNKYYNYIHKFDYMAFTNAFEKSRWKELPPGIHYIIFSTTQGNEKELEYIEKLFFGNPKNNQLKFLYKTIYTEECYYIAFQKLK